MRVWWMEWRRRPWSKIIIRRPHFRGWPKSNPLLTSRDNRLPGSVRHMLQEQRGADIWAWRLTKYETK